MYETDLKIVREKAVEAILETVTYDADTECHHDDSTICPATLCRVLCLFNIYPMDLMERIREYTPMNDANNPKYTYRLYWEHFVEHIIQDPNDFQVLK